MDQFPLKMEPRTQGGTRRSRRLRKEGKVPAVLYGKGFATQPIVVYRGEVEKMLAAGGRLAKLQNGSETRTALLKSVQYDLFGERPIHVDFYAVSLTEKMEFDIPVAYKGTPVGVTEEGGVLKENVRTLRVRCLVTDIPAVIPIEVGHLKLHAKLRLKDLKPMPGVEFLGNPETIIAAVREPQAEPTAEAAPAEAAAAGTTAPAEPELIKKGKKEEEGEAKKEEKK